MTVNGTTHRFTVADTPDKDPKVHFLVSECMNSAYHIIYCFLVLARTHPYCCRETHLKQ